MIRRFLALLFVSGLAAPLAWGQGLGNLTELGSEVLINNVGGVDLDPETGVVVYQKSVRIAYQGTEIFADEATYHTQEGLVRVRGNVVIYRDGDVFAGEEATYYLETDDLDGSRLRTLYAQGDGTLFFKAKDFRSNTADLSLIENQQATLTTHDSRNPNWRIESREIDILNDSELGEVDRIILRNSWIYAGDQKIFWLPYASIQPDSQLGYRVLPGYQSEWGAFLLNSYGQLLGRDRHTLARYELDLRQERGLAGGVEFTSMRWRGQDEIGRLYLYYADDGDPAQTTASTSRSPVPDRERYRVNLQHRIYLKGHDDEYSQSPEGDGIILSRRGEPRDDSLFLDIDLNLLSDDFFYEDFFQSEAQTDPRPDNLIQLVKRYPQGTFTLLGRFHINDFYQTDQRLPEIAFDFTRQPLFESGLFYDGSTSLGYYEEQLGDFTEETRRRRIEFLESQPSTVENLNELTALQNSLLTPSFFRFDSFHQLSRPTTFFGWLNLLPKIGARATSYTGVNGLASEDEFRFLFNAGIDASTKFSRRYPGIISRAFGLDGLLHVFAPYVNFSYLAGEDFSEDYPAIDRLTPVTFLRPLDAGQFTAVDQIRDWSLLRLGFHNRFHTKRDGRSFRWLEVNNYLQAFLNDPEEDRDFSNFFTELRWRPVPWGSFALDSQLPLLDDPSNFTEINSSANWMPTDNLSFSLGYNYLSGHPVFANGNRISLLAYRRLSDEWGVGIREIIELEEGTLELQQYSLYRDLTSWTAALGVVIRDNQRDELNYGLALTLSLKGFPGATAPVNFEPSGLAQ
ncbi:MAG: LPS assembly protein LptD [Verrucomicrobiota bacterium]